MAGRTESDRGVTGAEARPVVKEPLSINLVVVGYDGSDEAALEVRWAAEFAHQNRGALRVVWAWQMRDVWDEAVGARQGVEIPSVDELADVARNRRTGTGPPARYW